MRKPVFLYMKKREADQCLCLRYIDSTMPLLPKIKKIKSIAIFCGCTARFVSDMVGNAMDNFSHDLAQITDNRNNVYK